MKTLDESSPTGQLYEGDATWHGGPGWYWGHDAPLFEYPAGPFVTARAAILDAARSGYFVEHKLPDEISLGGTTEIRESPTSCATGIVVSRTSHHVGCPGRTPCQCEPVRTSDIVFPRAP